MAGRSGGGRRPVTKAVDYSERFALFSRQPLFGSLDDDMQNSIREIGSKYLLSFQELRQCVEIAVDFRMWDEPSLSTQWNELEQSTRSRPYRLNGTQTRKS